MEPLSHLVEWCNVLEDTNMKGHANVLTSLSVSECSAVPLPLAGPYSVGIEESVHRELRGSHLLDGRAADAGNLKVGPVSITSLHVSGSVAHEGVPFVGLHSIDLHPPGARRVSPHHGVQQRPDQALAFNMNPPVGYFWALLFGGLYNVHVPDM